MTSKRNKVLLGSLSLAAIVVGVMLFATLGKKKKLSYHVTDVQPIEQKSTPPARPQAPPSNPPRQPMHPMQPPAVQPPQPSEHATPAPAVDAGGDASPTVVRPTTPSTLKKQAKKKQLEMYRTQLTTLRKQRDKLMATIARLKGEGASKEAMATMQNRLQQLIEAEPRMKAHIEKLESEKD